ncbi:hypothetical protein [Streptomyces sp. C8S0]|nr:hypothetical protein [Streptomyces sp. C8S0]
MTDTGPHVERSTHIHVGTCTTCTKSSSGLVRITGSGNVKRWTAR